PRARPTYLSRCQNLSQMQSTDVESGAADDAFELHQATGIDPHDGAGFSLLNRLDLSARHSAGDFRKFDGEGAAESAALFGGFHLAEREPLDFRKQAPRTLFDVELAQGVAAIVKGDHAVETRTDVVHTGDLKQEAGELANARRDATNFFEA